MNFLAHIEFVEGYRSALELQLYAELFRTDRQVSRHFVELKGRTFFFRFQSRAKAVEFLKSMEVMYRRHNEKTYRVNW